MLTAILRPLDRFPFVACLLGAALVLAIPDILIFHGGGAAIADGTQAWAHFVKLHPELVVWLLGIPLLALICYTFKDESPSRSWGFVLLLLVLATEFSGWLGVCDQVGGAVAYFVPTGFVTLIIGLAFVVESRDS